MRVRLEAGGGDMVVGRQGRDVGECDALGFGEQRDDDDGSERGQLKKSGNEDGAPAPPAVRGKLAGIAVDKTGAEGGDALGSVEIFLRTIRLRKR